MAENTFITNPKTGRRIKVGSVVYKRIMKGQQQPKEKEEDLFYNEDDYIAVPDLKIFIKKDSPLYESLSLIREYDMYRNSLVMNLNKGETTDMDSVWNDLYRFGNCHELWQMVLLQCDFSMVCTLRLVSKFSYKTILDKYPLEQWIDWSLKKSAVSYYKKKGQSKTIIKIKRKPPNPNSIEGRLLQNKITVEDLRKLMDMRWAGKFWHLQRNHLELSSFHISVMRYCAKKLVTYHLDSVKYIQDIDELTVFCCIFRVFNNKIYYWSTMHEMKEFTRKQVPENAIVIDKRLDDPRYPEFFFLKTHIENTYLQITRYEYGMRHIDVTEYFQDVFK